MQITDEAIILSANKFGENSGIITVLTENHGIYKGLVRGVSGKNNRGIYQVGNIVEMVWRARLSEQLGNLSAGLVCSGSGMAMDNPIKLAALSSLSATIEAALQERDPAPTIFGYFKLFINHIRMENDEWQKTYILLEMELLGQLGYGLDLSVCAASNTRDDLVYVSPKSGRAVCRQAGLPYHDKMLKLPPFLLNNTEKYTEAHIKEGIILCSYFLDKYFFIPHEIKQPRARVRFTNMMQKAATSIIPETRRL